MLFTSSQIWNSGSLNYFEKRPSFNLTISSLFLFIVGASIAWIINILGQVTFPSSNFVPYLMRSAITLASDLTLTLISVRLLKQNQLTAEALGLTLSKRSIAHILLGVAVGIVTILTIAVVLYLFVPYHFVSGPLSGMYVLMESFSYLFGNSLEELIFRGFLLICLSQLVGWKLSVLIMALPFGLFHLQGTGLTYAGLSIMASTTAYSLVFSLSFVLTRSMWTAIACHVTMNIFLHLLTGMDGLEKSIYFPVFERSWPKTYDAGLLIFVIAALIISTILYISIALSRQRRVNWHIKGRKKT
jgi:membrane protease YdiL (CAAX protease family)